MAFLLANAGFDVWLGNSRGSIWSRNHLYLEPDIDGKKFWDFSFEDCGRYDLPAKIDFIIGRTGQKKIFFIGHSQGNTQFFAMAALRPEYNERIALMSAFAPVAYMKGLVSPQGYSAETIVKLLNIHELLGHSKRIAQLLTEACSDGSSLQKICVYGLFYFVGFNPPELEKDVEKLARALPNLVRTNSDRCKLFNHLDFIFAKHLDEWFNIDVLILLRKFVK